MATYSMGHDLEFQLRRSIELIEEKKMKHKIEVSSRQEGEAVEKAMTNPVTKAIVVIEGVLGDLSETEVRRVLNYIGESYQGEQS